MPKFNITIERSIKEIYQMELEGDNVMSAFDRARDIVRTKNENSTDGMHSVVKIETIKENT